MKRNLTKFKTRTWRKAVRATVKLWENRARGKEYRTRECLLCREVENQHGRNASCSLCVAYAAAGYAYCTGKWKTLDKWYCCEDKEESQKYAQKILKVAKRLEELIK